MRDSTGGDFSREKRGREQNGFDSTIGEAPLTKLSRVVQGMREPSPAPQRAFQDAALLKQRNIEYAKLSRRLGEVESDDDDTTGLLTFESALQILRLARNRGELDEDLATDGNGKDGATVLNEFYDYLGQVEAALVKDREKRSNLLDPLVIVVEGLDGTGKTTLVQALKEHSPKAHAVATGTPTSSMAPVRRVFDARRGPVSRAYYTLSNYVLQHEVYLEEEAHPGTMFVVDRWYASTCAYTLAYKNTTGGPERMEEIDASFYSWPDTLSLRPSLLILLHVDNEVRKGRVAGRRNAPTAVVNDKNPWDQRLDEDEFLAQRIVRALERVSGPREVVTVNANQTKQEVVADALELVRERFGGTRSVECHKK